MPKLTIFTATYNRGHLIERLYQSLRRQSVFDFEWLVVDDGSTDNTGELFKAWCAADNPFPIRYYRQENQGLIRSLNRGISLAEGIYFAKVDSDDYVTDDYMEKMTKWIATIPENSQVYAVGGGKSDQWGTPLKGVWPKIPVDGYLDATDLERAKYDLDADMSEAWRLDVLRQYPFPVWDGEKFAPEQIVLHQIALDGWKIRWFPQPVVICEYQEGGLTLGASKLEKENPMGYAMMYNHKILLADRFSEKCRNAMQMTALCLYAGYPGYLLKSNCKLATLLTLPLGIVLSFRRCLQYKKIK